VIPTPSPRRLLDGVVTRISRRPIYGRVAECARLTD
jgi:hypothetical protein